MTNTEKIELLTNILANIRQHITEDGETASFDYPQFCDITIRADEYEQEDTDEPYIVYVVDGVYEDSQHDTFAEALDAMIDSIDSFLSVELDELKTEFSLIEDIADEEITVSTLNAQSTYEIVTDNEMTGTDIYAQTYRANARRTTVHNAWDSGMSAEHLAMSVVAPQKLTYINISDRYGDAVPFTIDDYRELNPDGKFTQDADGIYEGDEQIAESN